MLSIGEYKVDYKMALMAVLQRISGKLLDVNNISKEEINNIVEELYYKYTESLKELKLSVIVPAFVTSELKRAFTMGFLLFLPFLIIDMIVSSTLMSMGMVMLPPSMISLPFKLMLFVVVDGWGLLIEMLISSFN